MSEQLVPITMTRGDLLAFEDGMRKVYAGMKNAEQLLKRATKAAVKKAGMRVKRKIGEDIRAKVNIKKKDIEKSIFTTDKTSQSNPTFIVRLSKESRLPLHYFAARQTNRGVTYKIARKGKREFVAGAFIMPNKWVVSRMYAAASQTGGRVPRLPLAYLRGPSPWGVFVLSGMPQDAVNDAGGYLRKEMQEQLRVAALRAAGLVNINRGGRRQ